MRIDAHAHFYPERFLDLIEGQGDKPPIEVRREGAGGERKLFVAGREFFTFPPDFFDLDVRLEQMAASAVDMQVISLGPPMVYWAESALDAELCRVFNDEMAQIVRQHPKKFVALAAVPLQDVGAAVSELERATRDLDVRGAMIPTAIGMKDLDSPEFIPFYEAAERLGALVLIHPIRPPGRERMGDYYLFNLIGFLVETTLAAARMIFSGTLEKYPGLKLCLSHAGGMALWIQGRFDHGLRALPACQGIIERPPSEYLKRMYFDTITHSSEALRYVIEKVGADRIMLGTDYPFAVADFDPVGTVDAIPELTEDERVTMVGGTAAGLLGLA